MPAFYINNEYTGPSLDMARFLDYDQGSYDPLTSYFLMRAPFLEMAGTIEVQVREESRPDLISYKVYGTTDYWWIIMLYNDLISNEEVIKGSKLRYPTISSLDEYIFGANKRQSFIRCKDLRIESMSE